MARKKDVSWNIPEKEVQYEHATLAVLMDIRDELKEIKQSLPWRLDDLRATVTRIDRRARTHFPVRKRRR